MPIELKCVECNKAFNVSPSAVGRAKYCSRKCKGRAFSKELMGNKRALDSGGNSTSFKKGHCPWNKDLKGIHLSPETEFKPGDRVRFLPIGSTTIRIDKQGRRRRWIKTSDGWIEYARFVWEQTNGPILDGQLIHHRDRDVLNDDLYNLKLMNRADHLKEHRPEIRAGLQKLFSVPRI